MDTNETLRKMRECSTAAKRGEDVRRNERDLRWLFESLDDYLSVHGQNGLPDTWDRNKSS